MTQQMEIPTQRIEGDATQETEELEWKESIRIQKGEHTGIITRVKFKTEPYRYTDVFIKLDDAEIDTDIELKYGCPTFLTSKSKLGRLMVAFGEQFKKGKKIKPAEVLIGQRVKFMTINKKDDDGREYARIVEDSIEPL